MSTLLSDEKARELLINELKKEFPEYHLKQSTERAVIRAMRKFAELANEPSAISEQLKEIWK